MTACLRQGCAGEIDPDIGFCNKCGLAPEEEAPPVPLAVTPPAVGADPPAVDVAAHHAGEPCSQPGCGGTLSDIGYCDTCGTEGSGPTTSDTAGSAVPAAASGPSGSGGSGGSGGSPTQGTSTIRRIGAPSGSTGRTSAGTSTAGRRRRLGAGMVEMPSVPERDPLGMVLENPEVREGRRFCGRCDQRVGRSRGPRPARTEGFCPHCGAGYSFTPKLRSGDLVAGQYLVAGCIAHGGLGWIYLAQDQNLDGAWMVLKGLLDSGDESAMAAALAEKRFLIAMRHPNIVRIYNFVQHDGAGYIVMEYVGGLSLRDLRLQHKEETGEPLSVQQAIGYVLGILPALEYLHDRDLLFCDFKPDNVIQTEDHLTLIDLGGVRHIGDLDSDLYGTVGYQAPEASPEHVSISSDLYTVGRTLAVLSLEVAGFQDPKRYATTLPPTRDVPALQRYEPFHRFLQKATAVDPAARFQSAADMTEQLHGVLRQVVAIDGGTPVSAASALFSAELGASAEQSEWQLLPVPTIDPTDPAAGVLATVALLGTDQRQALLESTSRSPELSLAVARFAIDDGAFEEAAHELDTREARASGWRAAWWRGVLHLAKDRPADALTFFDAVAAELPGELAPKLAIATCYERCALGSGPWSASRDAAIESDQAWKDQLHKAARYYTLVATTDAGYASAAFGLARVNAVLGDREGAVAALERVHQSSTSYRAARIALCQVQCAALGDQRPGLPDLVASAKTLEGLVLEPSARLTLVRDLHAEALDMILEGRVPDGDGDGLLLAGAELTETGQRAALEDIYRSLAKLAPTDEGRCALVDQANAYRPRTLT